MLFLLNCKSERYVLYFYMMFDYRCLITFFFEALALLCFALLKSLANQFTLATLALLCSVKKPCESVHTLTVYSKL